MADGRVNPQNVVFYGDEAIQTYFKGILKMTTVQADAFRAEAAAYIGAQFGFDVNQPAGFVFIPFMVKPAGGYRCYASSGESVPSTGWPLTDGAWMLQVTDPDGITVPSGPFTGWHLPPYSVIPYGYYHLQTDIVPAAPRCRFPHQQPPAQPKAYVYKFLPLCPVLSDPLGANHFVCRVESPEFGVGIAQGLSAPRYLSQTEMILNIRASHTWNATGGF
jgi:hypothetical protein